MLATMFKCSAPAPHPAAALRRFVKRPDDCPVAGVYNGGLLTIFDEERGTSLLAPWEQLVGGGAVAIAGTGFGDVYFWDGTNVCFLETQRAAIEPIDSEVEWVLSDFLVHPAVVADVLRTPYFDEVAAIHRPLSYDEVFILTPWSSIGGVDRPENYDPGDRLVYLSLVAQTLLS